MLDRLKNPKMLVPVYIPDFMLDLNRVALHEMSRVFKAIRNNDACEIKMHSDAMDIELDVMKPEAFETMQAFLTAIDYENAMKTFPNNKIIKTQLTVSDSEAIYTISGFRSSTAPNTNYTEQLESLVEKLRARFGLEKVQIRKIVISCGLRALEYEEPTEPLEGVDDNNMRHVKTSFTDFMGTAKPVSTEEMNIIYNALNEEYHHGKVECAIVMDAVDVEINVLDFFESNDAMLRAVRFEDAMKTLTGPRIVKLFLTLYDEESNSEFRTNGIRVLVDKNTDYTLVVKSLITEVRPTHEKLCLAELVIRGGLLGLTNDSLWEDNSPNYYDSD